MALSDHMKTLSDTVETVNDAALDAARSTIEDYGEPAYYLFTAVQFGNIHMRIDITDEQDGDHGSGRKDHCASVQKPVGSRKR